MIYSILSSPKDHTRHAREYKALKHWFAQRSQELGLESLERGDPFDPHHPYNQAFDALCREAERTWTHERNYKPSPMQLSHAFFQMNDPVLADTLQA